MLPRSHFSLCMLYDAPACNNYACGLAAGQSNAGISVNHPLWVVWYIKEVLPLLSELEQWPQAYMPVMLAAYLRHHEDLLRHKGLWVAHAAGFAQAH